MVSENLAQRKIKKTLTGVTMMVEEMNWSEKNSWMGVETLIWVRNNS